MALQAEQAKAKDKKKSTFTLAELSEFPGGLGGVYEENFERLLAAMPEDGDEAKLRTYRKLLSAVVACRAPIWTV